MRVAQSELLELGIDYEHRPVDYTTKRDSMSGLTGATISCRHSLMSLPGVSPTEASAATSLLKYATAAQANRRS